VEACRLTTSREAGQLGYKPCRRRPSKLWHTYTMSRSSTSTSAIRWRGRTARSPSCGSRDRW